MKKAVGAFYKGLDWTSNVLLVALFSALVLLLIMEVVGRFLFKFSFMWTEEVARYLFIWVTFIGGGVVFSKGGHLAVDVLLVKFPMKIRFALGVVFYVLMVAFLCFTVYTGWLYAAINFSKPLYSTYFANLGLVYLAVPVGSAIMILNIFRELYKMFRFKGEYYAQKEAVF